MKIIKVFIAFAAILLCFSAGASFAGDPENCLLCHKYQRLRGFTENGTLRNYYVDGHLYQGSIHGKLSCIDCHSDIEKVPHGKIEKVDCAKICHLDRWKTMSGTDFSHKEVADIFSKSIHGKKADDKPEIAALKPDCKYCHLNDLYSLPQGIPPEKVKKRCFNCHKEKGIDDILLHIAHRMRQKTSRPPLQVVELCSSCHADKDFQNVVGLEGPEAEAVSTYKETIHYRILQFGGTDTANCISCHANESIHNIRPGSDPQSSVNPDNRYQTCQAESCHPGASALIANVDSHLSKQKEKGPEIHLAESIMQGVMFSTLFLLFTLMGMETYRRVRNHDARFFRWLRKPQKLPQDQVIAAEPIGKISNLHRYVSSDPKGDLPRYSWHIIVNHTVMAITFSIAVMTGLPLFFHNSELSHKFINLLGGINVTRMIHRTNAIIFTLNCIYHVLVLLLGIGLQIKNGTFDIRRTQFPLWKDLKDFYFDFRYFLGLDKSRPKMDKFMYKQKLHYLAQLWGCSILTLSGCCLLFPEFMVKYIPFAKVSFNVLRLMHGEESILAFLVIALWHMYNVHIAPGRFPLQWTFWNGRIAKDHQIEEHFLEYERQVKEGIAECEEEKILKGEVGDGK
jgi:cytochrome b subunit of formate dehydrogenase